MYLGWSGEEDELTDESDYEETVSVDWLKAAAITLFTYGKDEVCILLQEHHPMRAKRTARPSWVVD